MLLPLIKNGSAALFMRVFLLFLSYFLFFRFAPVFVFVFFSAPLCAVFVVDLG